MPIVNGFRNSRYSRFWLGGGARRGIRLIGPDSFPRISNPLFPSTSRAFDVALPDRRARFFSFVVSMPCLISEIGSGIVPDPVRRATSRLQRRQCVGSVNPQLVKTQGIENVRGSMKMARKYREDAKRCSSRTHYGVTSQ